MGRASDASARLISAISDLMWETSYSAVTIDAICERARVKKGSFYYFFQSKADLATRAVAAIWADRRRELDDYFSATVPPLQRMTRYFESVYRLQREKKARFGRVLGCPYFTLGAEAGVLDEKVLAELRRILKQYTKYFESAIRDARSAGLVQVYDPEASARCVFSLFEGTMARARIQNDPELLRDLPGYVLQVLDADRTITPDRDRPNAALARARRRLG